MALNGFGKLIAVGGAAVGGFMKGQKDAEEGEQRKKDLAFQDEQRGQLRKDWARKSSLDEANQRVASVIARSAGINMSGQAEPAGMSMPETAAQPGAVEQAANGFVGEAQATPVRPSRIDPTQSGMRKEPIPKSPDEFLGFGAFSGAVLKPEVAREIAAIYGEAGHGEQAVKWLDRVKQAHQENYLPALSALRQGDAASAARAFNASGSIRLAEGDKALVPLDDKGNWRATLADGTTRDFNPDALLMSVLKPAELFAQIDKRADNTREDIKATASANKDNATAEYYRGAKTAATLAKGGGGGSGLQQEKWDEKQIQQHVKDAADVYSLPNMMGEAKPDITVKSAYTRLLRERGPEQADALTAQIRTRAEQHATDPKTGEINPETFASEYRKGWQAINARLMGGNSAAGIQKPAQESAPTAPGKTQAAGGIAKPAPPETPTTKLAPGSSAAAAEQTRLDQIRAERRARIVAESSAADADARARRAAKVAKIEENAQSVNSLYKR